MKLKPPPIAGEQNAKDWRGVHVSHTIIAGLAIALGVWDLNRNWTGYHTYLRLIMVAMGLILVWIFIRSIYLATTAHHDYRRQLFNRVVVFVPLKRWKRDRH
ncbi:MAG: hypothetical protein R3313_03515 [Candidatus Saccharimonadales bacterium]|nr:hypothetical protein [Candidatus Saccharimonadales bacterium]